LGDEHRGSVGSQLWPGSPPDELLPPRAAGAASTRRLLIGESRAYEEAGVSPASPQARSTSRAGQQAEHILLAAVAPRLHSPAAALLADCGANAEAVRDQLAAMLLQRAPELANRLHKLWPRATLQIGGIRN
jgi:hypothetical protein